MGVVRKPWSVPYYLYLRLILSCYRSLFVRFVGIDGIWFPAMIGYGKHRFT